MSDEYVTLKIPKELAQTIDRLIQGRKDLGFKSRAEFVKEAVRRYLLELEKTGSV